MGDAAAGDAVAWLGRADLKWLWEGPTAVGLDGKWGSVNVWCL